MVSVNEPCSRKLLGAAVDSKAYGDNISAMNWSYSDGDRNVGQRGRGGRWGRRIRGPVPEINVAMPVFHVRAHRPLWKTALKVNCF